MIGAGKAQPRVPLARPNRPLHAHIAAPTGGMATVHMCREQAHIPDRGVTRCLSADPLSLSRCPETIH